MASTGKNERNPSKAAAAPGRIVASKHLSSSTATSTRSLWQRPTATGPGASTTSTEKKPSKSLSATSTVSSRAQAVHEASSGKHLRTQSTGRGPQASFTASTRRTTVKPNATATKLTPSTSSSNARGPPPTVLPPSIQEHVPTRTPDPLQVAAQIYPWMYMTSALEACFQSAEVSAHSALERRAKELSEEETDLADRRIRFETERIVAFYDELSTSKFAKEAPSIIQTFLEHSDTYTRLNAEALRLAAHSPNQVGHSPPIQRHNEILAELENLQTQATQLESSILRLTESNAVDSQKSNSVLCSQILSVFSACLPVLRSRKANLFTAHELVRVSKENFSVGLQMESLWLSA